MLVTGRFKAHVQSVELLMNFDRDVLDVAISALKDLKGRLNALGIDNPRLTAENTLVALQGIRENDSLRPRYETIFNQALVLLVSYFASSVHDLFSKALAIVISDGRDLPVLGEEFKVSVRDLKEVQRDFNVVAPQLLINAKDISFQDMQSIARAFKAYLGIQIDRDAYVNAAES